MRRLIAAALIAAMAVLGTAAPFASAKALPHHVSSCFSPISPAYGYGMEAILWVCGTQYHTQAINQTGSTIYLCAGLRYNYGGWLQICNTALANGGSVNSPSVSYCNATVYQGSAESSVWIYTGTSTCYPAKPSQA